MQKGRIVLVGLLVIVLVVISVYNYIHYGIIVENQEFIYDLKKKSDLEIGQMEALKECRAYEIFLNGTSINADASVLDIYGCKKNISKIVTDNMLILRYSEMNCDVCVDSLISKLDLYMDSVGIENIALFTTSQNKGYIRRFKKVNKIKFDIYDIGLKLDSVLTDIGVPYFFVLSRNRRVNNMFVPQSEYIDLTDKYLHSIYMKYWMNL